MEMFTSALQTGTLDQNQKFSWAEVLYLNRKQKIPFVKIKIKKIKN